MGIAVRGVCPLLEVFGFEVVEAAPPGDDCGWALLRLQEAELMLNTAHEAKQLALADSDGYGLCFQWPADTRARPRRRGQEALVSGPELLLSLARGPSRVREELAKGAVSERFADLLSVAWVYGGIANLCIPALLLLLAGPLATKSPLAWRAALVIGGYYVLVGLGTWAFGIRRHTGLLVFVVFGLALLIPPWAARAAFRP